jgi:hypothetical protein
MGYRFSETNKRISSASDSNIVTKLSSRSITGHELPIQVHQHYGVEFHLVLKPNDKHDGSNETCMRRGFLHYWKAKKVCSQLEQSALQGLCSCIYDDSRVLSMSDKVEQCFKAKPLKNQDTLCNCNLCTPHTEENLAYARWIDKGSQDILEKQQDICCCRQIDDYYELMD